MKKLILMSCLLLSACGGSTEYIVGPKGDVGPTGTYTAPASLEGYYELPNGGYADIYEDAQGFITVRSIRLVVVNKDGSTGTLPLGSTGALGLVNNKAYSNTNQTYVALTHNVKQDNGAVLAGSLLTELMLTKEGDKLKIHVIVNNSYSVLVDTTPLS